jgi:predicted RND superfamily exporter protein
MLRSWKAGLIGSVPIIITALISFGVMGLLNIPLSTTTALLSSIAIGIGIDYSIHFIQNYKTGIKNFTTRHEAIQHTMKQTGKAILFNAIVVISGFMVLLFSVFPPNRTLGALVSMNMFTSFIGTLSIMMILLYKSRVFQRKS